MQGFLLVSILFLSLYILPGAVLTTNSWAGAKERRYENLALAVLLSLVFAPLTLTLLSRAVPSNDTLLFGGYVTIWGLAAGALRLFPRRLRAFLPDFSSLPRADVAAWLVAAFIAVVVFSLRLGFLQGNVSQINDDLFSLTKLTSIAATGLPSLYARQPLYPFSYYDLDYVAPALWVRYSGGAIGTAQAWTIHISIQTFAISLFLTRLIYSFAKTRIPRLFGLLAIHTATGFDIFFLPWLSERQSLPYMELWPRDLGWFNEFITISMPITLYVWVPQHLLALAIVGLIFYINVLKPVDGFRSAIASSLLLVALFRSSAFVFLGAAPGLALWHIYALATGKHRLRYLAELGLTGLVAVLLVLPDLADLRSKQSFLDIGLRSFVFLQDWGPNWLNYPLTLLVFLFLELGILFPLVLWMLLRPKLLTRQLRFWIFMTIGLLFPMALYSRLTNDVISRGLMPAQLAAVIVSCFVLALWERRNRRFVVSLTAAQIILSLTTAGAELYHRFTQAVPSVPPSSQWIARNTPLDSLVFYEQKERNNHEVNYGRRLAYISTLRVEPDHQYTPIPFRAWRCLPDVNLFDANALCSYEAMIPGAQPVFVKFLSPAPAVDAASFKPAFETEGASVFSLSCPAGDVPELTDPPPWITGPYQQLRPLLEQMPANHAIAASEGDLVEWLRQESFAQRLLPVVSGQNKPLNPLSQVGLWLTTTPEDGETGSLTRRRLNRQLSTIDLSARPVWFLLDYSLDSRWNELIYAHVERNYFVAQSNLTPSQWLNCKQRVVLALPTVGGDRLSVVNADINFGDQLLVEEWRVGRLSRRAGEIVPIELTWRKQEGQQLKFFVHLLDEDWTLLSQIDLPVAGEGTYSTQRTKMGLYIPLDILAGAYQIRLGVYQPDDGQRLTLPNGEDSARVTLVITP